MPSTFAWVDFDETSRRTMLDVIEKFRDQDTVDELGLGTIRDALSNYFFPGTSTISYSYLGFINVLKIKEYLPLR